MFGRKFQVRAISEWPRLCNEDSVNCQSNPSYFAISKCNFWLHPNPDSYTWRIYSTTRLLSFMIPVGSALGVFKVPRLWLLPLMYWWFIRFCQFTIIQAKKAQKNRKVRGRCFGLRAGWHNPAAWIPMLGRIQERPMIDWVLTELPFKLKYCPQRITG